MNLKKLFAYAATAALATNVMLPGVTLAQTSTYTSVEEAAFTRLYDAGIVSANNTTLEMAGGNQLATREQLATYLVRLGDVVAVTDHVVTGCDTFADDNMAMNSVLRANAHESCMRGYLANKNGAATDMFNYKMNITNAQAYTSLAKLLTTDMYGDTEYLVTQNYGVTGTPVHFGEVFSNWLEDQGIKTSYFNGAGFDVTMQRKALFVLIANVLDFVENPTPDCIDEINMLINGEACPTTDPVDPVGPVEEVKEGTLNVSLNSATLANNTQIPSTGTVRFAAVDFAASSADISLRTVEVTKLGLATIPTSTRIWFERNGVRVTGRAAFTSDGKAIVSFAPALEIKAGSTETLDLYVELATTPGFDFQFTSAGMDSSAMSTNGSFTTPVLRTVAYQVVDTTISKASVGGTTAVTSNGMELGAFQVQVNNSSSETRNASFKSITLRQSGNASLTNLGTIVLERNGVIVASNPVINGRDLTFSVNDTILDAQTATYYIKALVNNVDQATDDYTFEVRNTSDANIVEGNTAFRTTVAFSPSATNLVLNTYSIQGGDITFARDTAMALSNSVAPGTTNVVFMQGTMKTNSSITVEDPTVSYLNGMTDSGAFALFSTVYLQVGSSTFSYSPVANGTATGAAFNGSATINGTVPVKMWATLKQTAPANSIKFGSLQLSSFLRAEYVSNGYQVATAVGSIEGINVTVESSVLNVTRTDGKGDSVVAVGTSNFTVLAANLSSNQGNGVRVSRANFDVVASGSYMNNVALSLLVNGQVVQTKNVSGSLVTFDNFNVNVTAASGATIEVKADFAEAFGTGGAFKVILSANTGFNAVDLTTSATVNHTSVSSATFTMGSAQAVVSASNSPVLSQLFLSPSTDKALMQFRVQALNDTIKLRDLGFSGTSLNKLTNFRIVDASNNVVATATSATTTEVTFENISASVAPSIAKDAVVMYTLVANVNSNSTGTVDVTLNSLAVRASNGNTVTASFSPVVANTHTLAENTFVVTKLSNSSKNLTTSALRFSITASGKDAVTLEEFHFNNLLAGYDSSATDLKVYRGSTTSNNLVAAGTTGTPSMNLTSPTGNNIVDAGTTATFIVVLENTVIDPLSSSQDWSVSLSDLVFDGGLMATDFDNVGRDLALTETK